MNIEKTMILDLIDIDFKTAMIKTHQWAIENMLEINENLQNLSLEVASVNIEKGDKKKNQIEILELKK